eukprot:GFUD01024072.1.p1 GENE.GFUD01024072.1~~GFUD01024072.1.p1  ORF type:complete len:277 (+),score=9.27 GFUD01024072.1:135-965(+)
MSLESKWISNNINAARSRMMADDEGPTVEGSTGRVDMLNPSGTVKLLEPEEPVPGMRDGSGLVGHVRGESLEGEDCDMAKHGTAGAFESIDMWGMERSISPEDEARLSTAGHEAGVYRLPHEGHLTEDHHEEHTVDAGVNTTPPQGPWTTTRSSSTGPARNSPEHLTTSSLVRDWVSFGRLHYEVASATYSQQDLLTCPGRKINDDLVETRRDETGWKTTGRADAADPLPQVACGTTGAILATWPAISSQNATSSQATRIKYCDYIYTMNYFRHYI